MPNHFAKVLLVNSQPTKSKYNDVFSIDLRMNILVEGINEDLIETPNKREKACLTQHLRIQGPVPGECLDNCDLLEGSFQTSQSYQQ